MRKHVRYLAVVMMAAMVGGGFPSLAGAEVATPSLMPGFPMLAGNLVMVMWAPVPNAVKYKILVNGKEVAEVPAPPFQLPTPEGAGEYVFTVIAVDATGGASAPSSPGKIKVVALVPPKNVSARVLGDRVAVQWDAVPGASIYNVFRSEQKGKGYTLLRSISDSKLVDPSAVQGKTYYYVVTTRDLTGKESKTSEEAPVKFTVVAAPVEAKKVAGVVVPTKRVKTIEPVGGGKRFSQPVDLHVGKDGRLYVLDSADGDIKMLEGESEEVKKNFRAPPEAGAGLPFGMGADRQGNLYVAYARGGKVIKFSPDGEILLTVNVGRSESKWNLEKMPPGLEKGQPSLTDVAVFSDGRIAVSDQNFARVVVFDAQGKFLTEFGRRGNAEGEFGNVLTIGIDGKDFLYVGDPVLKKIYRFDKDLKPSGVIGNALPNAGGFLGVRCIAFDPAGRLVVSDPPMYTVQAFDAEKGEYLYSFGDESARLMEGENRPYWDIASPSGIAFDGVGRLYIAQPQDHAVVVREVVKK